MSNKLGIRVSTTEIRFAIVDENNVMTNKNNHRVMFPNDLKNYDIELFDWVYKEITNIIKNNTISVATICENGYVKDSKAIRLSNRLDAIVAICLKNNDIPVTIRLLQINESKMLEVAENNFGKTDKYWNKNIASCLVCLLGEKNG